MSNFYSNIKISTYLSLTDWLVFLGACSISIMLIIYGRHSKKKLDLLRPTKQDSLLEYLLMGRRLTLPLFVTTLVSTWYGGIFGVTQIAFEQGIYNLFTQGIFWYITYIIFALFLVKKLRSYGVLSLAELVQRIYGHKAAKLTAMLVFFKTLPIAYAISIGLFLQLFLPLSLLEATSLGIAIIVCYTLSGGLRTIVYSDVALFIIMCLGVVSVFVFSIANFGGLAFLQAKLPASYFSPCGTNSISTMMAWFLVACSTTFISPAFYQRCLAAANDQIAVRGILISTAIWFAFDICTTFGAMYAKAVIPDAESLNSYITYGIQLLPTGLKGLLLASIAAAIIATLDSFLFIASNVLFYDLPIIKEAPLKWRHVAAITVTAICTLIISLIFKGRVEDCWLVLKSYFAASLLLPILFGYCIPKLANERVFIINCVISCSTLTIWRILLADHFQNIDAFYIGCLTTCLIFLVYYLTLETRITMLIERIRRII